MFVASDDSMYHSLWFCWLAGSCTMSVSCVQLGVGQATWVLRVRLYPPEYFRVFSLFRKIAWIPYSMETGFQERKSWGRMLTNPLLSSCMLMYGQSYLELCSVQACLSGDQMDRSKGRQPSSPQQASAALGPLLSLSPPRGELPDRSEDWILWEKLRTLGLHMSV